MDILFIALFLNILPIFNLFITKYIKKICKYFSETKFSDTYYEKSYINYYYFY